MANAIKIVTGGTTGAQDGTLVSSGNKIVFTALNTAVNVHMRVDDGQWSADQAFTIPTEIEFSFDGGSTWKGVANSPYTAPEIEDINFLVKVRQVALASSTSLTFTTNGTYTSITVLTPDPMTGFTATPGDAQVVLAWSAVTNRTNYSLDRATNAGFTTGVTNGIYTGTSTGYTDTGRTNGTAYYYRIKAIGTGRYSDSTTYATANATPTASPTRISWTSETLLYQINEGSGTNIDDKNTTNNRDGTLTLGSGGSWLATGSPFTDPCIDINVGYIATTFAADASPSQQTAGTYEFLVKLDNASGNANTQMLLFGDYQAFYICPTSGGLTASPAGTLEFQNDTTGGPSWNYLSGTTVLSNGVWYHIAASWDASGKYIHINGVLEASNGANGKNQRTGVMGCNWFGRSTYTPQCVDGKFAMVRVWNVKRSTAQLLAAKQTMLG